MHALPSCHPSVKALQSFGTRVWYPCPLISRTLHLVCQSFIRLVLFNWPKSAVPGVSVSGVIVQAFIVQRGCVWESGLHTQPESAYGRSVYAAAVSRRLQLALFVLLLLFSRFLFNPNLICWEYRADILGLKQHFRCFVPLVFWYVNVYFEEM